jgi:magnesium-transporting ATPase (P-type)
MDPESLRRRVKNVGEIPFESERSYAAIFYQDEGRTKVAVKGALEVILPRCEKQLSAGGLEVVDAAPMEKQAQAMSENGYRFLAIAEAEIGEPAPGERLGEKHLPPLVLLGLVGLIDPPRPEAKEAVAKCQQAGIRVAMVTGDHPLTALSIARKLSIAEGREHIVTGRELTEIGPVETPEYLEAVKSARVFARVTSLQKLDIMGALVTLGHFVAVTGDGVNDAPALRKANIGVAMGSGTDVTKDTASIILLLLMVLLQNFHAFNCRWEYESAFKVPLKRNPVFVFGVLGALAVHVLAMHLPLMQRVLQVAPITAEEWIVPVVVASSVLVVMEGFKIAKKRGGN